MRIDCLKFSLIWIDGQYLRLKSSTLCEIRRVCQSFHTVNRDISFGSLNRARRIFLGQPNPLNLMRPGWILYLHQTFHKKLYAFSDITLKLRCDDFKSTDLSSIFQSWYTKYSYIKQISVWHTAEIPSVNYCRLKGQRKRQFIILSPATVRSSSDKRWK